jgi:hypothetical protein
MTARRGFNMWQCVSCSLLLAAMEIGQAACGGSGARVTVCADEDGECVLKALSVKLDGKPVDLIELPAAPLGPSLAFVPSGVTGCPSNARTECSRWISGDACDFRSCVCLFQNAGAQTCGGFWATSTAATFSCASCDSVGGACVDAARDLRSMCTGAAERPLPRITSQPPELTFTAEQREQEIRFAFDDPNGFTPAYCLTVCPKGVRCVGVRRCTPAIRDGRTSGESTLSVRLNAIARSPFQIGITPVAGEPHG